MMTMTSRALEDDVRWLAVTAHDRAADGAFVYAVSTTGVYCRPSCASRRPNRRNVEFFDTPDAARRAGFRPCRRCRPDAVSDADPWIEKIRRACVYLANVEGHPSLSGLAARIGGSPYHLQRNFKRIVGVTPREYAEAIRLRKVKRNLQRGGDVTAAMLDAGYGSSSRFYERAAPKLGMAPTAYRRGGLGEAIRYSIVDCPLGRLLVAATSRGVCSIAMGSNDAELIHRLRREYPSATVDPDASPLSEWVQTIVGHVTGRQRHVDVPLDIRATAFQWQVWRALAAIPYGETRTYSAIAADIGRPTAVRAVAQACAANPVALAIPCHRVVGAGGRVAGYRWGIERKRRLLGLEQGARSNPRERPDRRNR